MEKKKSKNLNIRFVHKDLISFFMTVCFCVKNVADKIKMTTKSISLIGMLCAFLSIFYSLSSRKSGVAVAGFTIKTKKKGTKHLSGKVLCIIYPKIPLYLLYRKIIKLKRSRWEYCFTFNG